MNHRTDEDLSTRARIRQAALVEFARHGFKGASIRGIARAAGVSPGLVQHYYGSKEGLREACDAYVLSVLQEGTVQGIRMGAIAEPGYLSDLMAKMGPVVDYLVTALTSGSEAMSTWFDYIIDYFEEILTAGEFGPALKPEDDPRAVAAVATAMGLGVAAFFGQIRRALDDGGSEAEMMLRVSRARLLIVSERIVGEEIRSRIHESLDRYERYLAIARDAGEDGDSSTRDSPEQEELQCRQPRS